MELPASDTDAQPAERATPVRRGVVFVYYLHLAAMPTLILLGIVFMSDDLRAALARFNEAGGLFTPVAKFSAFLACIITVATALSRCTPPRSSLLAILLIVDTPLIIAASAWGAGRLSLDLLLIEGIAEMAAVTLAMIPLPFTGTKETASEKSAIIPRMASVLMVLAGAVFYFVGICLAFVWAGDWTGFWLLLIAVGWSAFNYFRLMRTADVNPARGFWAGAAISAPVFIGFFVLVFYGIYKGATR